MNIILWVYFGLIVGFFSTLVDSRKNTSFAFPIVFSVIGALMGGVVADVLFSQSFSQIPLTFIALTITFSLIFLMLERIVQRSQV